MTEELKLDKLQAYEFEIQCIRDLSDDYLKITQWLKDGVLSIYEIKCGDEIARLGYDAEKDEFINEDIFKETLVDRLLYLEGQVALLNYELEIDDDDDAEDEEIIDD